MKISDTLKRYLTAFGIVLVGVFSLWYSTHNKGTCDDWAKAIRDKETFHLVLTEKKNHLSRDVYLEGTDLKSKMPTEFYDGSGWIANMIDTFKVGDTLIKDIGSYSIIIKRPNKTITIPFVCDDKIYK